MAGTYKGMNGPAVDLEVTGSSEDGQEGMERGSEVERRRTIESKKKVKIELEAQRKVRPRKEGRGCVGKKVRK